MNEKEKPDFTRCRNPDLAEGIWEMNQWEKRLGKRNPFYKPDYDELVAEGIIVIAETTDTEKE